MATRAQRIDRLAMFLAWYNSCAEASAKRNWAGLSDRERASWRAQAYDWFQTLGHAGLVVRLRGEEAK